jgi:magnesium-transporting ATPase (P-type)
MFTDNSQRMERNLNAYHQDGLLDILIGLGILMAGVFLLSNLFWLAAILPAVAYPIMQSAKKTITEPRIGALLKEPQQIAATRRSFMGFMVAGVVAMILGFIMFAILSLDLLSSSAQTLLLKNFPVALGVIAAFLFALTALLSGVGRFYLYGLLSLIFISGGALLNLPGPLYSASLGLLILLYGITLLARFVREHPRQP